MSASIELTVVPSHSEGPSDNQATPPTTVEAPTTSTLVSDDIEAQYDTSDPQSGYTRPRPSLRSSSLQIQITSLRLYVSRPYHLVVKTSRWARRRWQILAKSVGTLLAGSFGGATLYYTKRAADDTRVQTMATLKPICEANGHQPVCESYFGKPKRFVDRMKKRLDPGPLLQHIGGAEELVRLIAA